MLPIAILPIAGLLLRLGDVDLLDIPLVHDAGKAIFANLALIFAIGIAVGFARDNNGTAGLAGAIGYLVMISVLKVIDPGIDMGVLSGIISGLVAGALYNRFKDVKLPEYLAFFGGRRFVPIATGISAVCLGLLFGVIWPPLQQGINGLGQLMLESGSFGAFAFGVLNRLLIVTGLHHILNNLVWFVFGSFTDPETGRVVTGDLARYFAGDPKGGQFMAGMFPVMMFGLPAACLAMYRNARPERRKLIGGLLLSMALTAFPHRRHRAGGVRLHVPRAAALPAACAAHRPVHGPHRPARYPPRLHLLRWRHRPRPGLGPFHPRLDALAAGPALCRHLLPGVRLLHPPLQPEDPGPRRRREQRIGRQRRSRARPGIHPRPGWRNQPRSGGRLHHAPASAPGRPRQGPDAQLKALGAMAVVRPGKAGSLQVVVGPQADSIADEIRRALPFDTQPGEAVPPLGSPNAAEEVVSMQATVDAAEAQAWLGALGGAGNLREVRDVALTRLRVSVADERKLATEQLRRLGGQGVSPSPAASAISWWAPRAAALSQALQPLLRR